MKKLLCVSAHYSQGKREIVYTRITVISVLGVTHTHKYAHTHVSITTMTDLWMVVFQLRI